MLLRHTKHSSLTPNLLPSPLPTSVIFRTTYTTLLHYTCTLLSNVEVYTVNLYLPALERSRNRNISTYFGEELKASANAPPLKHNFTNTSSEHQKNCLRLYLFKDLCPGLYNVNPMLYRYTMLLLSQTDKFRYYKIFY